MEIIKHMQGSEYTANIVFFKAQNWQDEIGDLNPYPVHNPNHHGFHAS